MVTMREVAAHAGVSPKTVSRVLRNEGYVRDEIRERVQASVRELHYVPNTLAVSFRTGRAAAIGVGVPDIADPFFAQIIHAVEAEAKARHTGVIVTSLGNDASHEQEAVENLLKRQILGLITCPLGPDQSYLRPWQGQTAMVFIDRVPGKLVADSVIEDDLGGGHEATAHLLQQGHRRIAFVGDDYRFRTTALGSRATRRRCPPPASPSTRTLSTVATPTRRRSMRCCDGSWPCAPRRRPSSPRTPGARSTSFRPSRESVGAMRAW